MFNVSIQSSSLTCHVTRISVELSGSADNIRTAGRPTYTRILRERREGGREGREGGRACEREKGDSSFVGPSNAASDLRRDRVMPVISSNISPSSPTSLNTNSLIMYNVLGFNSPRVISTVSMSPGNVRLKLSSSRGNNCALNPSMGLPPSKDGLTQVMVRNVSPISVTIRLVGGPGGTGGGGEGRGGSSHTKGEAESLRVLGPHWGLNP